ncbi:unnamed protein product [Prunus brigantina]
MVMNGAMQSQANARLDGGANFNKELRTTVGSQSALPNVGKESSISHLLGNDMGNDFPSNLFREANGTLEFCPGPSITQGRPCRS